MAPEVLTGASTESSDIWSTGCLAYMMLSGFMPFDSKSEAIVVRKIQKGEYHFKQAAWRSISQDAQDFIKACLKVRRASSKLASR
jgi:serine/threonine protein kinase